MKRPFTITLQNRLALTYALFISLALGFLTLVINLFTGLIFNALIKDNIAEKSEEIVRAIGELYNPMQRGFDRVTVEAIGMYFVHEGYIVTVEDEGGETVWNARSCDMQQCMDVISGIASRMERNFRLNGGIQKQRYPLHYNGRTVGTVTIETYGPFFYSETETRFLTSLNRLLLTATAALVLFSIGISIPLARAIARPVNKSAEAARQIAKAHTGGMTSRQPVIRIPDQYQTRELAELSRSINELASELEEGERRQKQLTSDIAHELRTPLTCLQGNMEAMIDGVYAPDREHLVSCHEEILRLINLVKDLNILTSLEGETGFPYGSSNLNKTNFDLAKLIQITAEQFRAAAHEKGIALCLDLMESPINADYDRLKQVFMNLLSNAVKYTDSGKITVSITKGAKNWDIIIADTGIGIPEADIPHIFERFYRTDKSRSRSTGGAGIGLAVAAAIAAAHGGTIDVESKSGGGGAFGGSLFRVRL
ncbi:MAG: ATP-binding protein [Spirochaetaceae bacterium]|jgi:signal transduction histidine kinase|nr:ATP-binding protein [Spirochaetaceae bacterium]